MVSFLNEKRKQMISYSVFFAMTIVMVSFYVGVGFGPGIARAAERTLTCNGVSRTLTVGAYTDADGTTFESGSDLILNQGTGACTFTLNLTQADTDIDLASLIIQTGVTLTHTVAGTDVGTYNKLELNVTGNVDVQSGGSIDVSGKGYLGGNAASGTIGRTSGNTTTGGSGTLAGGSHGGRGGQSAAADYTVADSYDSFSPCTLPGGGGGGSGSDVGSNGGGYLKITTSGNFILNGGILADGGTSSFGGGAGGCVVLDIGSAFSGSGSISANGSVGGNYSGGGGGIVALEHSSSSFSGTLSANGGNSDGSFEDGSAGFIWQDIHDLTSYKSLTVDNNGPASAYYPTKINSGNDADVPATTVTDYGKLWIASGASTFSSQLEFLRVDTNAVFQSDADLSFAIFSTTPDSFIGSGFASPYLYMNGGTAKFDANLTMNSSFSPGGSHTGQMIIGGNLYSSAGSVTIGNGLTLSVPGDIRTSAGAQLSTLTIQSGGILTHPESTTATTNTLELSVTTLDVQSGGKIDVDGKGYMGGNQVVSYYELGVVTSDTNSNKAGRTNGNVVPAGNQENNGGSHGGGGGYAGYDEPFAYDPPPPIYDSITNPSLPGGGGSTREDSNNRGSNGGGVIRISGTNMTVNGNITANGSTGGQGVHGYGAGGTVYLNASGTVSGSGTISANGGINIGLNPNAVAAGGGGRVAVLYGTLEHSGTRSAHGGDRGLESRDGAAGTVYVKGSGDTYGDLIINNNGADTPHFHTTLLTTIPADDQDFESGYGFNTVTVSNYGVLNIPAAVDSDANTNNGVTELFHAASCSESAGNGDDDDASNGEIVYNTAVVSGGVAADYTCAGYNEAPTAASLSLTPAVNGTGNVSVSVVIDDADDDDTVRLRVEHRSGNCSAYSGVSSSTLSTTISASVGTPVVDNDDANGWNIGSIQTSSGANTISFTWRSATDAASANGTYCLFITPDDTAASGTVVSSTLTLDNVDPTAPGALSMGTRQSTAVTLTFGAASTETNFSEYKVFYKQGSSGVLQSDTAITSSTDSNLGSRTYNSATSASVSGLSIGLQYVANIFAYDTYRNSSTSTEFSFYTLTAVPSNVAAVSASGQPKITVSWESNGNPSGTQYYVRDVDNAGRNSGWITDKSYLFSDLADDTLYSFQVKSRNTSQNESNFAASVSASTDASAGSGGSSGGDGGAAPPSAPVDGEVEQEQKDEKQLELEKALQPSGFIKILQNGQQVFFTNKRGVEIVFDAASADVVALKQSDKEPSAVFFGVSFNPIEPSVAWELSGTDEKKCINARFREPQKKTTFDTYACVILDTIPPKSPIISSISAGYSDGEIGKVVIEGLAEPESRIIIIRKGERISQKLVQAPFYTGYSQLAFIQPLLYKIAAKDDVTYYTQANEQGAWSLTMRAELPEGTYLISAQAEDLAGNISLANEKNFQLEKAAVGQVEQEKTDDTKQEEINVQEEQKQNDQNADQGEANDAGDIQENDQQVEQVAEQNQQDIQQENAQQASQQQGGQGGESVFFGGFARVQDTVQNFSLENVNKVVVSLQIQARDAAAQLQEVTKKAVETTVQTVREVANNPQVEAVNEAVVAPVIVTAAAANVAVGFQLPQIWLFLRYLFGQPLLLIGRKKRKSWGVVYNAFTKQPLDLTTVRLINDATGRLTQSRVTDAKGRYAFMVPPGVYRMEVDKQGFESSRYLKGKKDDGVYAQVYTGEPFTVSEKEAQINFSIPLDPVGKDAPTGKILREHTKKVVQHAISLSGLIITAVSFVVSPTPLIAVFFFGHLFFYGLFYKFTHTKIPSEFGVVRIAREKKPIGKVVARLFDAGYNKLIDTKITDGRGRYAFLVGSGVFYVTYEKEGFALKQSPTLNFTGKNIEEEGAVISRDEALEKGKNSGKPDPEVKDQSQHNTISSSMPNDSMHQEKIEHPAVEEVERPPQDMEAPQTKNDQEVSRKLNEILRKLDEEIGNLGGSTHGVHPGM